MGVGGEVGDGGGVQEGERGGVEGWGLVKGWGVKGRNNGGGDGVRRGGDQGGWTQCGRGGK